MLFLYNTLSRKKEEFIPLHAPKVGMYVCGPTVYGDPHLGHARPAITFDILFRYLNHLGYKVRYVRNITDVGHLENDADAGEDKIAKKARLDQVEPMEVVQYYTNRYHKAMEALNVLPPSIEPHASGHIMEQIEFTQKILDAGYAYESEGSVYFDVEKYNKDYRYGKLSGRNVEEMLETTRELDGQSEKRRSVDFALWKKASPEHIMRWKAPWSEGFPGWHMECSAMGTKYLGEEFDIHGGGMDLMFPHHECEIAQSCAALGKDSVRYWMHNNMITIGGQKMGKSLGNFITLEQFFTGNHPLLNKAFSPMTIRFFILQAHYRSTVDFSSEALEASEKGLERLLEGYARLQKLKAGGQKATTAPGTAGVDQPVSASFAPGTAGVDQPVSASLGQVASGDKTESSLAGLRQRCEAAMNDDLNTPIVISNLFDALKTINLVHDGKAGISEDELSELKAVFKLYLEELMGIQEEATHGSGVEAYQKAVDLLLNIRLEAKKNKDWATSDRIRNELSGLGFEIKDTKDGFEWRLY